MFTYQLQIYPLEEVQYVAIYPGSGIIGNNKNSPEWWDVRLYTSDIYKYDRWLTVLTQFKSAKYTDKIYKPA